MAHRLVVGAGFVGDKRQQMQRVQLIRQVSESGFGIGLGIGEIAPAIGLDAGLQGIAHIVERRRAKGAAVAALIVANWGIRHRGVTVWLTGHYAAHR